MLRSFLFIISISLLMSGASLSQEVMSRGHVKVELVAEQASIQPGQPFWVAVHMTMDPDWHIYWKNPGDSGLAPKIQWELPQGFSAGPMQWPYPDRIHQPPLTTYGYAPEVFFLTQVTPSKDITANNFVTLTAKVSWLACKIDCIPGKADVKITLPVNEATPTVTSWAKDFANTQFHLPLATSDWTMKAVDNRDRITLTLSYLGTAPYPVADAYFFPEKDNLIHHAMKQPWTFINGMYQLDIPRSTLYKQPVTHLEGIIVSPTGWRGPDTEKALMVSTAVQPPPASMGIVMALVFALIGGLILNLMPCVLPVISLKILGFMKHAEHHKSALWAQGLSFTAGIVVSFWVLAGILMLLRLTGQNIGWGFQFQSPPFLIFLSLLFFILALNLLGVFEILIPVNVKPRQKPASLWTVFFNGVLATITATPCTAPFMGTALGFGLTQPPIVSFLIFTFLGLGMALPYLILSLFPALIAFLPKPGMWMVYFKRFLGVLLLGTVCWLLWVLSAQLSMGKVGSGQQTSSDSVAWQAYSPELVAKLRAEGRIVFIDFTAKWCLTCQVNERIAIYHPDVIKRLEQLNVAMVKADWTLQDAAITQALAGYGKNSIPLYVLYGKDSPDPVILPEIITPSIVLEALNKISNH